MKKMLAGLLAAAIAVSCVGTVYADPSRTEDTKPEGPSVNQIVEADKTGGVTPVVSTTENGDATLDQVKKTSKKTVKISSKVTVDGVKYTVTEVGANAFANCKKAKTIELPKTIETIGAKAFTGAKKLKTIELKSTKAPKVNKKAFKGLNTKKMTIKVSKKMSAKQLKKFENQLKKAGFKGKVKKA